MRRLWCGGGVSPAKYATATRVGEVMRLQRWNNSEFVHLWGTGAMGVVLGGIAATTFGEINCDDSVKVVLCGDGNIAATD